MRFFGESMIQNHKIIPAKKAQYPKYIIALLHPDFPNVIGALKFLEKLSRHDIELFYNIEHKGHFSKLFVRQLIEIFFNRAFACFEPIEFYFSHDWKLAYMRTYFKDIIKQRTT